MLKMGFFASKYKSSKKLYSLFAFISLLFVFAPIAYRYEVYDTEDPEPLVVTIVIFIVWFLYGIAHSLSSNKISNNFCNVLDMISKAAFGLFLYGYIRFLV